MVFASPTMRKVVLLVVALCFVAIQLTLSSALSSARLERAKPVEFAVCNVPNNRPPPEKRTFRSTSVDQTIDIVREINIRRNPNFGDQRCVSLQICSKMVDKDLASLFVNCLPNTLDTTVQHFSNDTKGFDTFIITGDIPAMWLRDSSAQVSPYVELAKNDPHLQDMLKGVIMRQARSILIDAYANAFLYTTGSSPHGSDRRRPPMSNKLWEGKYELDSLVWPMRLATQYWQHTSDPSICTDPTWLAAVSKAMDVIVYQQQATTSMQQSDALYYSFGRMTTDSIDTLFGGVGMPSKSVGLSRSPFRPSDDSHIFPYLVPANAMAVVVLRDIGTMLQAPTCKTDASYKIAMRAIPLAEQIDKAIASHGIVPIPNHGNAYGYEVNGYGAYYNMDDANVPSLLSLPYLGYTSRDDPHYINTRRFILSPDNPYFANGTAGAGIGSPHTGIGNIWPISVIMQALTSSSDKEIVQCLELLKRSSAGTGFMHESFWKDDPSKFTRSWFAWANSLFGELILTLARERPHLLFGTR